MEYRKEPIKDHPEYMIDTDGNIYNKNGKLKSTCKIKLDVCMLHFQKMEK